MTKIISFASQKGGVGKSTLCIQQAFYLSLRKKKRVLVLDMDGQGNTSSRLAGQRGPDEGTHTRTAELFADTCRAIEVLPCPCGADLIYTPTNDPELFDVEAAPLERAMNPARHLAGLLPDYDYVLIDCPPSLGRKLLAALVMSTHVVCPVKLSGFAVDGVEGLLSTIIGVREAYNSSLEILGLVINDMDRSVSHDRALAALEEAVPELLFRNRIMHRPPLDTATSEGVPIWELRHGHVARREVEAVLDEMLERVG